MHNAKIVCTLGPASDDRETIRALADAGMSVARLNASHGSTADREAMLRRVQAVDAASDEPLATMVDLQGPEIRTAEVDEPVEIEAGSEIRFVAGETVTTETIGLSHPIDLVSTGDTVLLDDGHIQTTVETVDDDGVVARVDSGGSLGSRKGVTVRGVDLDLEFVTEADRRELRLAVERDVDFVAASFVRDARHIYELVDALEGYGGDEIAVIAKIEREAAVENLDGIVDAADGVMVARGDLGVECPLEDVPVIQKRIIRTCMNAGVPVITATEMLDSMMRASRPTRAEASDVANAILDGTDAVMLSGETAVGDHPVRVVETMGRIVRRIESSDEYETTREQRVPPASETSSTEALARSARFLARDVGAAAVVAATESGYTARKTAKFRPGVPIVAITPSERIRRRLAISWGTDVRKTAYAEDIDDVLTQSVTAALDAGVAESGDTIVVLSGMMSELEGTNTTNTLKLHVVAETVTKGTAVVDGSAAGPVFRTTDGDLSTAPDDAVVVLPPRFDGEFDGDLTAIAAIIDATPGMTGYAAIVARELGIPMVSNATLSDAVADGTTVTVDGERGVVYEGDVTKREQPS